MSKYSNVDNLNDLEFQELVQNVINRDNEAFETIYQLLNDRLFAYALSRTSSRSDALDVVQETFIELWGALTKFHYNSRPEFLGFVYVILKRRLYRIRKKSQRSVELEDLHIADNYEIEVEDYRFLEKKIKGLPENYQELLKLRYWSYMTYRDIAAFMRINENTAKVWHHRAIKSLQAGLQKLEI